MSTISNVVAGACVAALCLPLPQAQAALVDRGGGMLYDTVLNVTWLQDANYAKTSGYDADGRMTWSQANTWANNLSYGGFSGWRLARNTPGNGATFNLSGVTTDGTTDVGYNITGTFSELSYMYYVNLGLKGGVNTDGTSRSDSGVLGDGSLGGQKDVGLVKNLQNNGYWSGTAYPEPGSFVPLAFAFGGFYVFGYGAQYGANQDISYYAWAVRPGDVGVAAVPVPGSVALLAGGLALVGVVSRRRRVR